jgi:hypothetical protein
MVKPVDFAALAELLEKARPGPTLNPSGPAADRSYAAWLTRSRRDNVAQYQRSLSIRDFLADFSVRTLAGNRARFHTVSDRCACAMRRETDIGPVIGVYGVCTRAAKCQQRSIPAHGRSLL